MNEKQYRQFPAQHSTKLSAFHEAPDAALMDNEMKDYFVHGHFFEQCILENIKHPDFDDFSDYHIVNTTLKPSDLIYQLQVKYEKEGNLLVAMENELHSLPGSDDQMSMEAHTALLEEFEARYKAHESKSMFTDEIVYNTKPDDDGNLVRNGGKKTFHFFLDLMIEAPEKIIISSKLYEQFKRMASNLCNMSVDILDERYIVRDLLKSAKYQKAVTWKDPSFGYDKKALFDFLVIIEINSTTYAIVFDAKTCSDLKAFKRMYSAKYWVQDMHYSEGLEIYIKDQGLSEKIQAYSSIMFLAASKAAPHICQSFEISNHIHEKTIENYQQLSLDFKSWEKIGSPARGWRPKEYLKYVDYLSIEKRF